MPSFGDDGQENVDREARMARILAAVKVKVGDTAPDWTLATPDDGRVSFYDHSEGKPSLVVFSDSLPPDSANFYALHSFDDDGDPVAFFEEYDYSFTLLLDADAVAEDYGAPGTPWILIVGSDKVVQFMPFGAPSMEQAVSEMKAMLLGRDNTPNQ
jgi:nucleotide-binding universal stress UspA family protein